MRSPGWEGSTESGTAVGQDVAVAVRVVVVLPTLGRPRAFDLPRGPIRSNADSRGRMGCGRGERLIQPSHSQNGEIKERNYTVPSSMKWSLMSNQTDISKPRSGGRCG